MHWCMDETLAVLAMIPFIGYFFRKLHLWYHTKMGHTCHEKHCDSTHAEHAHTVAASQGSVWDAISYEDLVERHGEGIVEDLREEASDHGVKYVSMKHEATWYVDGPWNIKAVIRGKTFLHDEECCEHGWRIEE